MADMGNVTTANAADLNTAAIAYATAQGWTMPDGSYPIRPANMHGADDLSNAVRAVGRGNANHDAIRRHIISRANAIGQHAAIPDNWKPNGAMAEPAGARSLDPDAGITGPTVIYRHFQPDIEIRSAAQGGDGRTVVGYSVPFDFPTYISPAVGTEAFDRSAFNHQLSAMHRVEFRGPGHKIEGGPVVGHVSVAKPETRGLYTESKISKGPYGDQVLSMIEDGTLPHQSIGVIVNPGDTQVRDGVAYRMRADLTEIAAVSAGAYGDAAPTMAVRSQLSGLCPTCGHVELVAPVQARSGPTRTDQAGLLISGMRRVQ
jgi:HK97 family phage prohead protease